MKSTKQSTKKLVRSSVLLKRSLEQNKVLRQQIIAAQETIHAAHLAVQTERNAKRSLANQILNMREALWKALGEDPKTTTDKISLGMDDLELVKRLAADRDAHKERAEKYIPQLFVGGCD